MKRSDNFNIINEILTAIEEQRDEKRIDWSKFSHTALGMTKEHWEKIIKVISDEGLTSHMGSASFDDSPHPKTGGWLTLKGLKYLSDSK